MIPWLYLHLPAPSLLGRLLPPQPRLLFKSLCFSKLKTAVVPVKSTVLDPPLQTQSSPCFFEMAEEVSSSSCMANAVCSCYSYVQHGWQHYRTGILMIPFSVRVLVLIPFRVNCVIPSLSVP